MRKWILVAALALLIGGGGLLVAVANLDSWLNENRDWVGAQLSATLGREVSFAEVGISLRNGLGVRARDLRIGDDPAFSKQPFVAAEAVDVRVKLLPALFGDIQLDRVVLRSPSIQLIRSRRGSSVDSLGGSAAPSRDRPSPEARKRSLAVSVAVVDVRDGRLRWIDRTSEPAVELAVEQLDFRASDLEPGEPIGFELAAAVLGASERNLRASGSLGPWPAEQPELEVDFELDPLALDQALAIAPIGERLPASFAASGPAALRVRARGTPVQLSIDGAIDARRAAVRYGEGLDKPAGTPLQLTFKAVLERGSLTVSSADLVIGDTAIHSEGRLADLDDPVLQFEAASPRLALVDLGIAAGAAEAPGELREVEVRATLAPTSSGPDLKAKLHSAGGSAAGVDYQGLDLALRFQKRRATIEALSLRAFEGDIELAGYFDVAGQRPYFDLESKLRGVRIEELIRSRSKRATGFAQGALDAQLTARGAGSSWEEVRRVLRGSGNLVLADGRLRDVNLAESALESLTGLPGLTRLISPSVRTKYPNVFGVGETVFEKLDAQLEIRDGFVHARDVNLRAQDYALRCEGRYSLDNALDMSAVLQLSEPLSRDLIASVEEARYLRDSSGRIEIPLRLKGSLPGVRPQPDLRHVGRAVQRQLVGGLLERALGSPRESGRKEEAAEPEGEPAPPANATEQLLRRGLDGLLRRKD